MKIVYQHATSALFTLLEELSEMPHESWRCLQLRPYNRKGSPAEVEAIRDMVAGVEGSIFMCEDGDILILFQGSLRRVIDKVTTHLGEYLSEDRKVGHSYALFGVFDLDKHWQGFRQLCESKYLKVLAAAEEKRLTALPISLQQAAVARAFPKYIAS